MQGIPHAVLLECRLGRQIRVHARKNVSESVRQRLANREDNFKHADNNHQKEQWSPDAMKEQIVEPAAVLGRKWRAVACPATDLGSPAMRTGGVANHRKGQRLHSLAVGVLIQEERDCVEAGSMILDRSLTPSACDWHIPAT